MRKDTGSPRPIRRVLVANRGEIAIRVMRACREMGITSIAVFSDADALAPHVAAADIAERIGPPAPAESYLDIGAILAAAQRARADAVHPGYGFLSENAAFARAVIDAGLTWIGPPPETQEALGNKLAARRAASDAGVPVVPGLLVSLDSASAADLASIGLPLMLKAAAGGGGRGMRRVDAEDDLPSAMEAAAREATAAFGDGTLYAERMVSPARHVEVQLLGDRQGNLACLGERDCSVQRRHQKLVEETPSPAVDGPLREALFDSARRVAGTVAFENAATVEFLVDAERNHYFLEMNTRLQVEHGVTELATGLDLVAWQIRVAAGEALDATVLDAEPRGHAIEARIYAEDPWDGFRPVAGTITAWEPAAGPGVRVDHAVAEGPLTPEYDPLLAKLMVHASDRPAAVDRLRRALDETLVGGLQTDIGFHRWLVDQPAFVSGDYHTGLIADGWLDGPDLPEADASLAALAALRARGAGPGAAAGAARLDASAWASNARNEALRRWPR
ncbi:MAG TPA: biotin carboxylase N-terminal domain-containing protein [Candidatus Limnocylindria bacterium]|nr:biotin carboxylase N-terminal domain-containing protein [Candidatus Limnocylindria bacterium]